MTRPVRAISLALCMCLVVFSAALAPRTQAAQTRASTITLTFLRHVDPPANKLEQQLIKQYEAAHPNIRINYQTVPDPNVFTKFEALTVAGSPPDIVNFGDSDVPEVWSKHLLAPVNLHALGVSSLAQLQARYVPHALSGYIFGGRLYAIPHELSDYVMWVNYKEFRASRLNPKDYPRTWEALGRIGQKLVRTRGGKTVQEGIALPFHFPGAQFLVLDAIVRQAGGKLFSNDGRHAYLTSPAAVKAVTMLASLAQKYKITDPALNGTTSGADRDLFQNGVAAMMLTGGSWYRGGLKGTKAGSVAHAVPYPRFAGGPNIAGDLYGYGLVVDAHSSHQADAWKFIAFLASHGTAYFRNEGLFTGDRATVNSRVAATFPDWATFKYELAHGVYSPRLYHFNEIGDIVGRTVDAVVLSHQDPKSALASAQARVSGLLNGS